MTLTTHGAGNAADEHWHREWLHWSAAIAEGLCPEHRTPLDPVPTPARRITGHCRSCRMYWGINLDTGQAGWWLDWDPQWGRPAVAVPEWIGWREP